MTMVPGPEGFEIVPETLPETSPAAVWVTKTVPESCVPDWPKLAFTGPPCPLNLVLTHWPDQFPAINPDVELPPPEKEPPPPPQQERLKSKRTIPSKNKVFFIIWASLKYLDGNNKPHFSIEKRGFLNSSIPCLLFGVKCAAGIRLYY